MSRRLSASINPAGLIDEIKCSGRKTEGYMLLTRERISCILNMKYFDIQNI